MFGFKKKVIEKKYIGLDIGTEFIKATLFRVENGSIFIENFIRVRQKLTAMKNGTITNIKHVIAACEQAIVELNPTEDEIAGSFIGIAGELVKGIPIEINIKRTASGPITEKEIEDIIGKIEGEAYTEAEGVFQNLTGRDTIEEFEIKLTNITIIQAKIDGFEVENPVGLDGKNMLLKVYFTFAPQLHIGYVRSVSESLGMNVLGIVAEPFAIARAIKKEFEKPFSGILIDVGGGTTDIAVVHDGVVSNTQMIAFGGRVFTKRISADLNVSLDEAENLKLKYSKKEVSAIKSPEIRSSILKDTALWVDGIEIALTEFENDIKYYPSQIYICGGGSLLTELKEALLEHPWTTVLPFQKAPKVSYLTLNEIDGVVDETGQLNKTEFVPSVAISRYALEVVND